MTTSWTLDAWSKLSEAEQEVRDKLRVDVHA